MELPEPDRNALAVLLFQEPVLFESEEFPFDFNPHIVSEIIEQHIEKIMDNMTSDYEFADGGTSRGFLMKAIPETFSYEYQGIKKPFYGIISIEPFENFYAK